MGDGEGSTSKKQEQDLGSVGWGGTMMDLKMAWQWVGINGMGHQAADALRPQHTPTSASAIGRADAGQG